MRPPAPGETIVLERSAAAVTTYFNAKSYAPPEDVRWELRTPDESVFIESRNGHWRRSDAPGEVELVINGEAERWAAFLAARGEERIEALHALTLEGGKAHQATFRRLFRVPPGG
jgi:hypothetical protein